MTAADDLIAAVKAGDADAVQRILARGPGLAAAQEDGISAVRLALYQRQPAVVEVLLQHSPRLDVLDHAALGWTDDLRARRSPPIPGSCARRSADGFTAAAPTPPSSAARPRSRVLLAAGADPDARRRTTRPASARCTPPRRRATPRRSRLLLEAGADPDARQPAASPRCTPPRSTTTRRAPRCCCATAPTRTLRNDQGADAAGLARAGEAAAVLALLG